MAHNFRRGDLLICMHSTCGNEGRIVQVVDDTFDPGSPGYKDWLHREETDIVVQCMSDVPLRFSVEYEEENLTPEVIEATVAAVSSKNYCLLCFSTNLTAV